MAEGEQNYKNHERWLPAFHFFVIPVLLVNALNAIRQLYQSPRSARPSLSSSPSRCSCSVYSREP